MYFDSVADALTMGGHGVFVWGAYGISFVIIFFVLLRPVMSIRTLNAGIRQELSLIHISEPTRPY